MVIWKPIEYHIIYDIFNPSISYFNSNPKQLIAIIIINTSQYTNNLHLNIIPYNLHGESTVYKTINPIKWLKLKNLKIYYTLT